MADEMDTGEEAVEVGPYTDTEPYERLSEEAFPQLLEKFAEVTGDKKLAETKIEVQEQRCSENHIHRAVVLTMTFNEAGAADGQELTVESALEELKAKALEFPEEAVGEQALERGIQAGGSPDGSIVQVAFVDTFDTADSYGKEPELPPELRAMMEMLQRGGPGPDEGRGGPGSSGPSGPLN